MIIRRLRQLFRRRRALHRFLQDARTLVDPERDPLTAAFWVHEVMSARHRSPAAIRLGAARYLNRVARDPARRVRWLEDVAMLRAAEAGQSATAHFEALTGHRMDTMVKDTSTNVEPARVPRRAPVRPPRRLGAVPVAVFVLVALGAWGWHATQLPDPFSATGAGLSGYAWEEVGLRVRGATTSQDGRVASYHEAMTQARQARTVVLGLWVRYDPEVLREAHGLMLEAIARASEGYPVPPQAFAALREMEVLLGDRPPVD